MTVRLRRGDLLPRMVTPAPGPETVRLAARLDRFEAPGVNTLADGRAAPPWLEARGSNILDVDGNRYIDFTSGFGVAAIGHRHPRVVAAVRRQAGRLLHGLADVAAHPLRTRLAERLAAIAPIPGGRIHFSISGGEAVEVAIKTATLATGRAGIVAFEPAYHGTTLGALAATSRRAFRQPFAPHLTPQLQRFPYACEPDRLAVSLTAETAACVIVEPVVGREGVLLPPVGWLTALSRLCARTGTVLIVDEIFTGLGRTGHLFAGDHEGLRPDILCCGKALGGGLPIAAVIGRRELMAAWKTGGEAIHTATFLAHPLACAAALAALDVLEQERLVERAATEGRHLGKRLSQLGSGFDSVAEVRGRGLLWGLEMTDAATAAAVTSAARREGVWILAGGPEGRVVQFVPPLVITRRQLDRGLDLFERALRTIHC